MCVTGRMLQALELAAAELAPGGAGGDGFGGGKLSLEVEFRKPVLLPGKVEARMYGMRGGGAEAGDMEVRFRIQPLAESGGWLSAFQVGRYVVRAK